MDQRLHELPFGLWAAGSVAGVLGAALLIWLLWHALRGLADHPRVPRSRATYGFYTMLCLLLLAGAALTAGLARLLRDHARVEGKARLGDVRCQRAPGGKVRISYLPATATAEAPAPPDIESDGGRCEVEAVVVTNRAVAGRLGLGTLVRVTKVGDEARAPANPGWLVPQPGATDGLPLRLMVREARAARVSAPPEERNTLFHLMATPDGLVLEKAGG